MYQCSQQDVYYIIVSLGIICSDCILFSTLAREDVIRVKQLVALSRKKRKYDANLFGESEPSQRSSDSLTAVSANFALHFDGLTIFQSSLTLLRVLPVAVIS